MHNRMRLIALIDCCLIAAVERSNKVQLRKREINMGQDIIKRLIFQTKFLTTL